MKKLIPLLLTLGLVAALSPGALAAPPETPSERQLNLAGRAGVKIQVKRDGWYKVTRSELVKSGLDGSAPARSLQLFADGKEVPILVHGVKRGRLASNGWIEFYGLERDTLSTDARTYWLIAGDTAGRRIPVSRPGKPRRLASPRSFDYTAVRKGRTTYFPAPDGNPRAFYGQIVLSEVVTEELILHHQDPAAKRAVLDITVRGLTPRPHGLRISLNGTVIDTFDFAGQIPAKGHFQLSGDLLKEGKNTLSFVSTKGEVDASVLDEIRLKYAHRYEPDNDTLAFPVHPGKQVRVDGFSRRAIRLVDITDPGSPRVLRASVSKSAAGYAVTVPPAKRWRRLHALVRAGARRPAAVVANRPSSWHKGDRTADMVIITHRSFQGTLGPLRELREQQGLKVAVIDVEDLYDEFSYGAHGPEAIRRFLDSARKNWQRAPRFVLLVGDATYDPRNYLGHGNFDFVPTQMIQTVWVETSSDDWFVDFDLDGLPEMNLGRLPVRTSAQAATVVAKIVGYERAQRAPSARSALLVGDANEDFDFSGANERLRTRLAPAMPVEVLNRGAGGLSNAAVRQSLLGKLNAGPTLVNYFGHGSAQLWTKAGILQSKDADDLRNANSLSFYVMTTCNNGYFTDPTRAGLGEALLRAEGGGAFAVFASSGYVDAYGQLVLNDELYKILLADAPTTIGEATTRAKAVVPDMDIRRTFALLGDPASRIR